MVNLENIGKKSLCPQQFSLVGTYYKDISEAKCLQDKCMWWHARYGECAFCSLTTIGSI